MNINTNYNVRTHYSNFGLRNNNQEKMANNSAPAFKMANPIVKRGLVGTALAALYGN